MFLAMTVIKTQFRMNHVMREPSFHVCENKSPDQLSGSRTADQRLSSRYIDNTNTLLYESEISNLRPSVISVSVLLGDLGQKFSCDAAQICLIFLLRKDTMNANVVACVNFTKPKLLRFDI